MRWVTRLGDEVTTGDLVALSVLGNPDARGRIVGAADDGLVECTLGEREDPRGISSRLRVEVDNILMLLRKGGDPMGRKDYDYYRATPLMRDPETEDGKEGDEGDGGEGAKDLAA